MHLSEFGRSRFGVGICAGNAGNGALRTRTHSVNKRGRPTLASFTARMNSAARPSRSLGLSAMPGQKQLQCQVSLWGKLIFRWGKVTRAFQGPLLAKELTSLIRRSGDRRAQQQRSCSKWRRQTWWEMRTISSTCTFGTCNSAFGYFDLQHGSIDI
jgi:hypothetical protein